MQVNQSYVFSYFETFSAPGADPPAAPFLEELLQQLAGEKVKSGLRPQFYRVERQNAGVFDSRVRCDRDSYRFTLRKRPCNIVSPVGGVFRINYFP